MEKVQQLGQNHPEENIQVNGKMISIMAKVSIFLQTVIVGMVHLKKVKQMANALVFLMEKLLNNLALMINYMDMQKNKQKFNHNPIFIKENLELAKNLDMGF